MAIKRYWIFNAGTSAYTTCFDVRIVNSGAVVADKCAGINCGMETRSFSSPQTLRPSKCQERSLQTTSTKSVRWSPSRKAQACPGGGNKCDVITFNEPAKYLHYGGPEYQGEVAHLTRNILIQRDESSTASRFGAHILIREATRAEFQGAELKRVGQMESWVATQSISIKSERPKGRRCTSSSAPSTTPSRGVRGHPRFQLDQCREERGL